MTPDQVRQEIEDIKRRLRALENDAPMVEVRITSTLERQMRDGFEGFKKIFHESTRGDVAAAFREALAPHLPKLAQLDALMALAVQYPVIVDLLNRATVALQVHEKVDEKVAQLSAADLAAEARATDRIDRREVVAMTNNVEISKARLALYASLLVAIVGAVVAVITSHFK